MNKQELVLNAIDSDGLKSTATTAGYINPEIWNRQVLTFLEEQLVVANKAKVFDDILGAPGDTLNVTIDSTPTAAAAVAESADVSVTAYATTQVVFTPTEYAYRYQLSDKEARRAFYDVQSSMVRKIGYALALLRDDTAVSLLQTSAGNAVVANGVASSAIASTDTIDYSDVVNAATAIRKDYLIPKYLIVSAGQAGHLSQLPNFYKVNEAGSSETLRGGRLGSIYGMEVFWTTQISPSSNKSKAIVLGVDQNGEASFGIARKALPQVRTQRFEAGRYTDIVGVEEWDMQVLRANGICTIESYDA